MRFINEYNHVSDMLDVKDIFREYADKYDISFNQEGENWSIWDDNLNNTYYTSIESEKIFLVILFDLSFGSASDVDGNLGDEFQNDMIEFQSRLENIGYKSEIDWSGGFIYTIEITKQ